MIYSEVKRQLAATVAVQAVLTEADPVRKGRTITIIPDTITIKYVWGDKGWGPEAKLFGPRILKSDPPGQASGAREAVHMWYPNHQPEWVKGLMDELRPNWGEIVKWNDAE